jgi:hypothetical protein
VIKLYCDKSYSNLADLTSEKINKNEQRKRSKIKSVKTNIRQIR